jgi:[ribosomal protein S5]-alanine N-acetyltransferase
MKISETERVILREMTPDDAESLYLLNDDPEVIRYTGDPPFENIEAARSFLLQYDQYRKYGIGRWAMINKTDTAFLGWCGLKFSTENMEYDIGYRLFKKYWNKGYASEAAAECLKLGFDRFKIQTIVGHAMKGNIASIRVFEKIGMRFLKTSDCGGYDGVIYIAEKTNSSKK